jgi:hypothetical protein
MEAKAEKTHCDNCDLNLPNGINECNCHVSGFGGMMDDDWGKMGDE